MSTPYAARIKELSPDYDPRHIEAFMRTQFGTLDHLDRETFTREVRIAEMCVDVGGLDFAERAAKSHGF